MTSITLFSFNVARFFYNVKGLKTFWVLGLISQIAILVGALVGGLLHYFYLLEEFGRDLLILAFLPYLLTGFVVAAVSMLRRQWGQAKIVLTICLLPSLVLSPFGLSALTYLALALGIRYLEKRHRKRVVSIVAEFSMEFSPLYDRRLANRYRYKSYESSYRLLDLIDVSDFTLVSQVDALTRNHKLGLSHRELSRTFKVKGIPGTTTVQDQLFVAPQIKGLFSLQRKEK